MAKVNKFLDFFGLYKNKAIVFVEFPNKRVEKHVYDITSNGRLCVYPSGDERYALNPVVHSNNPNYDADSKQLVLRWRDGSDYATPLFEDPKTGFSEKHSTSEEILDAVFLGRFLEKELKPEVRKQQDDTARLFWFLLIVGILCFVNLVFLFRISENLGVKLF
jgi:hypothetical protein